ncbi:MAG: Carboxymethylenebutenolidase [Luteibacter sp.]|uniref:dienelactone hydrolase family protein n=1 Tax=Luteibacter sp. TaxID=1886636 RepID=UPI00137C8926|nr:dienelactone hydrolase family protein [Luteibacter sp.]KAF1007162.1 MAG: Carboxymethylenebutenolidase [Luteibacter sp.]
MSESLTVTTSDGSFHAYVARPAVTPAPIVIVVQEIFGLTEGIRSIADGWAREGYLAVAPDLFWRFRPGIVLSEHSEDDWKQALDYYLRLDLDKAVDDIEATLAAARDLPEAGDRAGVTGYCLGGLLTFLTAARGNVDAAAEYYGSRTDEFVARAVHSKTPLLIHLAGEDKFMDRTAIDTVVNGLRDNPHAEVHVYEGRDHAFARPNGAHFHADDAARANARTRAFFRETLRD